MKNKKRKEEKELKKNRGITLIALVVTIVVLVVLATVSINLVFNQNGIISWAEKAGKFQTNAEASDRHAMDVYKGHITNTIATRGENKYTCPYCGAGHDKFEGEAVIFVTRWTALGNCSCGHLKEYDSLTTEGIGGNCPQCGDSVAYESMLSYYETSCCNYDVGDVVPEESEWKK